MSRRSFKVIVYYKVGGGRLRASVKGTSKLN